MKKPDEDEDKLSRVLSVRVPEWAFQAFEQIQVIYNVKQSELIRMTPLLFLLLAERNLSLRQRWLTDWEKRLKEKGPFDWDWAEIREIDQERIAVNNNEVLGKKFLETLKDMAKQENVHNTDAIVPENIKLEEGEVVPKYFIFHGQTLRQIATEIAATVPNHEIKGILAQGDNRFDPQLLAAAGKKLGLLDAEQKKDLRDNFLNALKTRDMFDIKNRGDETASVYDMLSEAAYEVARNIVRPTDVQNILKQVREEGGVPHRYDSWLLTKSRKKLGRPLREAEKSRIRVLFQDIIRASDDLGHYKLRN